MASHGQACREDLGMGSGTGNWTVRNRIVTKPRTQSALRIKSEGDSKTRSRTWTRTRNRTSVRNV
jgi:hypothetical protein